MLRKQKKELFFSEISDGLDKIVNRYIYLYGDLNIDLLDPDQKHSRHFSLLEETYDLTNLIQHVLKKIKELFKM